MKLKRLTGGAVLLAAFAAQAADGAGPDANYLGIQGGINDLRGTWNADVSLGPGVSLPGAVGLKRGNEFGLFGGRRSGNWRFEGEYQHGTFDITSIQLGPVSEAHSASGSYDALTANVYRTGAIAQGLTAYGGLGLGWGRVRLPQMGFASTGCNCFADSSRSGFAWLARAGLEYALTANDNVFAQYTFLGLPRPGSGGTPGVQYERKNVGAIGVGYRRSF